MMGLDGYSFRARWLPCVLVATPAVLAVASWLPSVESSLITGLPLLAAVAAALSQLARNRGRDLQSQLWRTWGGPPTTQVLRHGSERIPRESLARYRRFIDQLAPDIRLPTEQEERAAPAGAFDGRYAAATTALINRTQDKKEFARLYHENVVYGFWRNLRAIRRIGLWAAAIAFVVAGARAAVVISQPTQGAPTASSTAAPPAASPPAAGPEQHAPLDRAGLAGLAMLASAVFFGFFKVRLSDDLVRRAAFNYADRLVEASEQLVVQASKQKE